MTEFYESILSNIEIEEILNSNEVLNAKSKIETLQSGVVSFSIPLKDNLKSILLNKMGLNLDHIYKIPMRWIKGDTYPHIDTGATDFEKTYLVYLSDSEGKFIINSESFLIKKGAGYVFNEGLKHETINTGLTPRLLIGPLSETGLPVGGGNYSINEPGGTTIYIKQLEDNGVFDLYYSTSTNSNWNITSFPLAFNNNDVSKGNLKIEFTTDIIISNYWNYFICGSDNLQFGSSSLNSNGSRAKFIIDIPNFEGLIYNGDQFNSGKNNIFIYNLYIDGNNNTTHIDAGWLGRNFFGNGSSNNFIVNCSSIGNIGDNGGGILGANTANNVGSVKLIGCSSSGSIGLWGGGIIGRYAGILEGTVICDECWSTGNISDYAGGIFGANAGSGISITNPTNRVQSLNCYSLGDIANGGGGIFGENSAEDGGTSQALNSYSRGNINSSSGGIFGQNAGQNNGTTNADNCYSSGTLIDINSGIYGQNKSLINSYDTNCYIANGIWSDISANSNLTGFPVNPSKIGTTWTSFGSNMPFILTNMGYTPYSRNNISVLTAVPYLIKDYSHMIIPGNTSSQAITNYNPYSILEISEGDISSYITFSINITNGSITTTKSTVSSLYILYIQVGSYNITKLYININTKIFINSNLSGSFNIIAKNANDIMLATGNSNNGLFYSINKGVNWSISNISSGDFWSLDIYGVYAVAVSKDINNVAQGILYSIDSGITWLPTNKTNNSFRWIMISPDGSRAIAASDGITISGSIVNEGLWYSNNTGNGFNFWQPSNISTGSFRSVYISSNGIDAIAAGNIGNRGIWYSTDCGLNWTRVTNSLNQSMRSVLISPNGEYAVAGASNFSGIWYSKKTNNGFDTWSVSNINIGNWRSFAISPDGTTAIAVSNSDKGIYISILAQGVGFINWDATNKSTGNFSNVVISPDGHTAYAGSNGNEGIWMSKINFSNWGITNIIDNDYFSIICTSDSQRAVVSSDKNGGIKYSTPFNTKINSGGDPIISPVIGEKFALAQHIKYVNLIADYTTKIFVNAEVDMLTSSDFPKTIFWNEGFVDTINVSHIYINSYYRKFHISLEDESIEIAADTLEITKLTKLDKIKFVSLKPKSGIKSINFDKIYPLLKSTKSIKIGFGNYLITITSDINTDERHHLELINIKNIDLSNTCGALISKDRVIKISSLSGPELYKYDCNPFS